MRSLPSFLEDAQYDLLTPLNEHLEIMHPYQNQTNEIERPSLHLPPLETSNAASHRRLFSLYHVNEEDKHTLLWVL